MNFRSQALGCPPLQWGLECRPRSRSPPRTLLQAVLRYLPVARGGFQDGLRRWQGEPSDLLSPARSLLCGCWRPRSGLEGLRAAEAGALLPAAPVLSRPLPTLTQVLLPLGLS